MVVTHRSNVQDIAPTPGRVHADQELPDRVQMVRVQEFGVDVVHHLESTNVVRRVECEEWMEGADISEVTDHACNSLTYPSR